MEDSQTEQDGRFKRWFQDNLRIIVSVIVVLAIASGIYSYSKRTQPDSQLKNIDSENEITSEMENKTEGPAKTTSDNSEESKTTPQKQASETSKGTVTSEATSRETESSFIETARRGEGKTHLARRALANYLEKNPNSSLTKEHKIYIEDYLRRRAGSNGMRIGGSLEFSKDLIQAAIGQSKNLNTQQLKNLQKFSQRVPSLS